MQLARSRKEVAGNMKKEIWDWLHPKLCGNSGNNSIKISVKAGCHARSTAVPRVSSSISSFGCWSNLGRMSGVDVNVDETEGVSMETLGIGVVGQLGGIENINGAEEALADTPSFEIQEDNLDESKPHDVPNQIIQSKLQASDHGRIKEIYCRFGFLADFLSSRRKHRHDAFNAFDGKGTNVESEIEVLSGQRSPVGRLKKILEWKNMVGATQFHFEHPKLEYKKVKGVLLKKIHHKFQTKKLDGCLVHTPSKGLERESEALEDTSEQKCCNYVHFSSSAERKGCQMVCAPKHKTEDYSQLGATDYRIMTDSDYVVMEW